MMRIWALLAIALALSFSGLAAFTDHTTLIWNSETRFSCGIICSGSNSIFSKNFSGVVQPRIEICNLK